MSGSVGGRRNILDDSEFDELLMESERLDLPLYLHPGISPMATMDGYTDFAANPAFSPAGATKSCGWYNLVAIPVLRLAASEALECRPGLKIVIGHHDKILSGSGCSIYI